jgi:hypothetical protein
LYEHIPQPALEQLRGQLRGADMPKRVERRRVEIVHGAPSPLLGTGDCYAQAARNGRDEAGRAPPAHDDIAVRTPGCSRQDRVNVAKLVARPVIQL